MYFLPLCLSPPASLPPSFLPPCLPASLLPHTSLTPPSNTAILSLHFMVGPQAILPLITPRFHTFVLQGGGGGRPRSRGGGCRR